MTYSGTLLLFYVKWLYPLHMYIMQAKYLIVCVSLEDIIIEKSLPDFYTNNILGLLLV
jgi:hypothetical protein